MKTGVHIVNYFLCLAGCEYDRQARVDGLEVELLVTKLTCQTIENDLTEMCKSYSELQGELKSKSVSVLSIVGCLKNDATILDSSLVVSLVGGPVGLNLMEWK